MRPFDYLRILRRRWWILALGAVIGSLLAFVTQPSQQSVLQQTAPHVRFRATHLLIADPTSTDKGVAGLVGYDRLALLTIRGEVPRNAIKRLGGTGVGGVLVGDSSDSNGSSGSSSSSSSSDSKNSQNRNQRKATDPAVPNVRQGKGTITIWGVKGGGIVDVAAVPDPPTGALAIIATGGKDTAPLAADVFADELTKYLDKLGQESYDAKLADLQVQRDTAVQVGTTLDQQMVGAAANPLLVNQLQQRKFENERHIQTIDTSVLDLTRRGPTKSELATLEKASDGQLQQVRTAGGSTISSNQRLILGGAIGLLLGLVLLIVMELLGARIRDVASTEGAARMPVIAEIPVVKVNRADRFVVATAADPSSLTAEAYRSLRTSLLAMWQRHPKNTPLPAGAVNGNGHSGENGHANGNGKSYTTSATGWTAGGGRPLQTLLVTSPGPAEGKSISVVNLAAAFAETGMSVIVIDSDFRRPTQCRYLDRPKSPNLADLDLVCTPEDLEAVLQDTEVPGVRLAASAPTKSDPGHAIAVAKAAVRAAQQLADIVLVDSPPLLLANDASDLALGVDATILLARSGWTRRSGVVASADLLRRLEAPVIGVVIVGAEHGVRAGYYGYYGYYGYGYGYAHPGEVSIMHRLMPWKAGRKPSGSRPRSAPTTRPSERPSVPAPPGADPDDPWV